MLFSWRPSAVLKASNLEVITCTDLRGLEAVNPDIDIEIHFKVIEQVL